MQQKHQNFLEMNDAIKSHL